MATNSIYTSVNTLNLNFLKASESRLNDLSKQFTSDGQSIGYRDVDDIKIFIDQEVSIPNMQNFINNNKFATTRLDFMMTKVNSIQEMTSLLQQKLILQRNSQTLSTENLSIMADDMLRQVTYFLNARYDGEYVFSGSASNAPAVIDLTTLSTVAPNAASDFTYFLGNTDLYSIRSDESQVVTTSVTANDQGFEQLIRALRIAKGAIPGNSDFDDRMGAALNLCDSAIVAQVDSGSKVANASRLIRESAENLILVQGQAEDTVKKLGYLEPSSVASQYFQEKMTLSLSREIVIQTLNNIQKLVEALPR